MVRINRRDFVRYGALGAAAGHMAHILNSPAAAAAASAGMHQNPWFGTPKLLCIFLRGGNDAVNTVIPVGPGSGYDDARNENNGLVNGSAWVDPATALPLSGTTYGALHPSLHRLVGPTDKGRIAYLHAVGSVFPSRSHFLEMQKLETARDQDPNDPADFLETEGFAARAAEIKGGTNALRGVSIARGGIQQMFSSTQADRVMVHMRLMNNYDIGPWTYHDRIRGTAGTPGSGLAGAFDQDETAGHTIEYAESDQLLRTTGRVMLNSETGIKNQASWLYGQDNHNERRYPTSFQDLIDQGYVVLQNNIYVPNGDVSAVDPSKSVFDHPQSYAFMRDCEEAKTLLQRTTTRFVGIDLGGFDTHLNQVDRHADLLAILSRGVKSVYVDTRNDSFLNLIILVVTEFGRTNFANGSDGTDHGVGTLFFAVGKSTDVINGGLYNCKDPAGTGLGADWVPLTASNPTPYEDAVPTATSWETVLAEICRKHFAMSHAQTNTVVPHYTARIKNTPAGQPADPYSMLNFLP